MKKVDPFQPFSHFRVYKLILQGNDVCESHILPKFINVRPLMQRLFDDPVTANKAAEIGQAIRRLARYA